MPRPPIPTFRTFLALVPLAVLVSPPAYGQAVKPPAAVTGLEAVVITGAGDRDDRRDSTAAKIVVTREDLVRYGDSTVADVLKRVPGVTVDGVPGRGGEIRMRGLGNGYTQILLNGEPTAQGFSLDSLSPNLIERIEVMRTTTADRSNQAVAGTINIILKQVVRQGQKDLKAAVSSEHGEPSANLDLQLSDRDGSLSYTLAGSLRSQRSVVPSTIELRGTDAQGQPAHALATAREDRYEAYTASLTPRLTWKADERDTVVAEGFLSYQEGRVGIRDERTPLFGPPPLYGDNDFRQSFHGDTLRGRLTWNRELEGSGTLEVKLGLNRAHRQLRNTRRSMLPGQSFGIDDLALDRRVSSAATDTGATLAGKLRLPYGDAHSIALGWDGELSRRSEDRVQRDILYSVEPPEDLDQAYTARVRRLAFFAQDEWDVTSRWSTYAGVRWEGLDTRSSGNTLEEVRNRSGVLSPVFQSLWKVPDTKGDQVRVGLSRTYRAPTTRELLARPVRQYDNSPNSPDTQGNPDLRPELAWGLDVAYERHFEDAGLMSANFFMRRIQDVILQELFLDAATGRWVSRPINNGNARAHGIELEIKGNLRKLLGAAPAMEVRANLVRNWSKLDAVPGPNDRLGQQVPLSGNLGLEWRLDSHSLTLGGNLGFQRGGLVRLSSREMVRSSVKRSLDIYGLWKMDAKTQLRLSAANLLRQDQTVDRRYADGNGVLDESRTTRTFPLYRLTVEMKL